MSSPGLPLTGLIIIIIVAFYQTVLRSLFIDPLSRVPGPKLYALTKWRLALDEWRGTRTPNINLLHQRYGRVVRIGPREVHFNSTSALRTIYGAGSGWERTTFYRMFDVYDRQNLFTFAGTKEHADRKRLLARAYAKSSVVKGPVAASIELRIREFMDLLAAERQSEDGRRRGIEIFHALHFFSLDNITNLLYGPQFGGTSALRGDIVHRALLDDILHPARRRLTWFQFHLPKLTNWLYTRTGVMGMLVAPMLPVATYTAIREHALRAVQDFSSASEAAKAPQQPQASIMADLWKYRASNTHDGVSKLHDLDIASELGDHFLAGIDTTSDTLMFLIWALSLPQHKSYQDKLIAESQSLPLDAFSASQEGIPSVIAADRLPYLDACLKETLRLYAPIPESEPRCAPRDTIVDGYTLPAGTVASCSPYSLHRESSVFTDPLRWNPERWLNSNESQLAEMKKWWWAFSSGGRMCIGMHFAMAQMALVPAIYRKYTTRVRAGTEKQAPGITSRLEMFGDDLFADTVEGTCWIDFVEQK